MTRRRFQRAYDVGPRRLLYISTFHSSDRDNQGKSRIITAEDRYTAREPNVEIRALKAWCGAEIVLFYRAERYIDNQKNIMRYMRSEFIGLVLSSGLPSAQ